MSDTPRTDEYARCCTQYYEGTEVVYAPLARDLERELNAANARIAELEKDKARLDWLENKRPWVHNAASGYTESFGARSPYWGLAPKESKTIYGATFRAAIDAAMKPKP